MNRDDCLIQLNKFHHLIDDAATKLAQQHATRLQCKKGCASCCVDDLTVFTIEAENIKQHYTQMLKEDAAHANGACAFLNDQDECRIYQHRPYVCRTQGLPLRWLEEVDEDEDEIVEMRDICPLNEAGTPIEELDEEECWTIGPSEEDLAQLQLKFDNGNFTRVALRDLFQKE